MSEQPRQPNNHRQPRQPIQAVMWDVIPQPTRAVGTTLTATAAEQRRANLAAKSRFTEVANRAIAAGVLSLSEAETISRKQTRKQGAYIRALRDLEAVIQAKLGRTERG